MWAASMVNPMGNAIKNSFAVAVAAGAGEEFVPMLADHIRRLNGGPAK